MTNPLNESLDQIVSWISRHAPQALETLNPPATPADIRLVESTLGVTLPDDFKAFLALHDGEASDEGLAILGDGNQLLPCARIIEQYRLDQEMGASGADSVSADVAQWKAQAASHIIFVKGPVKPLMSSPRWVPISCANGDVIRYIDYDPAPTGVVGQIIEVWPEGCSYAVLANSFGEFLRRYAEELQAGAFEAEDDGFILSTEEVDMITWGVPEWLQQA